MNWLFRIIATLVIVIAVIYPFYEQIEKMEADTSREATVTTGLPAVYVSPATTTTDLPDFASIRDITERKKTFFAYLLPAIHEENQRIEEQRVHLRRIQEKQRLGKTLTNREKEWLNEMANFYRVEETQRKGQIADLLNRADIIPDTLILIQAANESGWGTSRFATDALNFFGQWCWTQGCGLVPAARPDGQVYEVRTFESMEASVRSYIRNLNTHFAYSDLRGIRSELRANNDDISSTYLTQGLLSYSERGEEYIEELNQMIRINRPIILEVQEEIDS
ncbi:peptidoglycan hydrolase [Aliidiomarina minuta]|uniref:Peptidoglycan hydrolase n=1 Tax=Aliidiomarina minuta TaxID=880057 RepID=A0A432W6I3_9GAMM|nr:glucosaminidase domain-containing protein [Aliidiomarina minuta]RUO25680.1 peptidoglycan hydrolase [Aliidiomarina minuta]